MAMFDTPQRYTGSSEKSSGFVSKDFRGEARVKPPTTTMRYWDRRLETLSAADLKKLRFERLRELLLRCEATNDFYRRRFRRANFDPDRFSSVDDLRRLEPTTKVDVLNDLEAKEPFGHRLGVSPGEIREIFMSGGSSGLRREHHAMTASDLASAAEIYAMTQHWMGGDAGDLAMCMAPIGVLTAPLITIEGWRRGGLVPLRVGPYSTAERVDFFRRYQPAVIQLPINYIPRFRAACVEQGIFPASDIPDLQCVRTSGGAYPLGMADEISAFFGATLHEVYGCSQAGTIVASTCERGASQDGERGVLHVLDSAFHVEVVDPETLEPVAEGEFGEVILTPLYRSASPLIRYRMRDRVRLVEPGSCGCGRQFTSLECGSIARYDDMMKIKGINVWKHEVDRFILDHEHVEEFNAELAIDRSNREIARIYVELSSAAPQEATWRQNYLGQVGEALRRMFRLGFLVEEAVPGSVVRYEGKGSRWTDRRTERPSASDERVSDLIS